MFVLAHSIYKNSKMKRKIVMIKDINSQTITTQTTTTNQHGILKQKTKCTYKSIRKIKYLWQQNCVSIIHNVNYYYS